MKLTLLRVSIIFISIVGYNKNDKLNPSNSNDESKVHSFKVDDRSMN